jgi:hypothetical protein
METISSIETKMDPSELKTSNSTSPRSHHSRNNDEPDIHPELTLKQLQNPAERRRPGNRSFKNKPNGFPLSEPLEINEMFDLCGRRSRSRLRDDSGRRSAAWEGRQRRSSVAVMPCSQMRSDDHQVLKYFTPKVRLTPQSMSAVHYLSISPPRIRITDALGRTSPEQQGKF